MADPGFLVGGAKPLARVPTSDVDTFQWKCMRKQKNWILLGAHTGGAPLDPPMVHVTKGAYNRGNSSGMKYGTVKPALNGY